MRQEFEAPEAQPNLVSLGAVTGVSAETTLINGAQWLPLPVGANSNNYLRPGQVWELQAWGICTYPATTPGTTAFTARISNTSGTGGVVLGTASAAVQGTTQTAVPWQLIGNLVVRSVGLPGANSVLYGRFCWTCPLGIQAAGAAGGVLFGGVVASNIDASVSQALQINVTPSVTGQSFTPELISWRSIG